MKIVEVSEFGDPLRVASCVDAPEPGEPAADEIVVQTLAAPIHPADLMLIRGSYLHLPDLPFIPGIEAACHVLQTGRDVRGLKPGDHVVSLKRQTWAERRRLKADEAVLLQTEIDPLQLAMLYLNPLTAWSMLSRPEISGARGESGKWIVQNAANSSVGHWVARLAPHFQVKVINVVRRPDALDDISQHADNVAVDGIFLTDKVNEISRGGRVVAALDAVSGSATGRLAECLIPGGTILIYGNLADAPSLVPTEQYLFRGVHVTGFSVTRSIAGTARQDISEILSVAAGEIARGFTQKVEATYPVEQISVALAHAMRERRKGKILVTFGNTRR